LGRFANWRALEVNILSVKKTGFCLPVFLQIKN
jgi:hypothetical protein